MRASYRFLMRETRPPGSAIIFPADIHLFAPRRAAARLGKTTALIELNMSIASPINVIPGLMARTQRSVTSFATNRGRRYSGGRQTLNNDGKRPGEIVDECRSVS